MKSNFFVPVEQPLNLLPDEKIIEKIRNDNNENALDFLMDKYKNFVYSRAKSYFLVGGEKQDIIQEGLIGLFKAIKNFDLNKDISFKSFADLCIRRQIISAIKTSTRQKHIPLNTCISLNSTFDDDSNDKSLDEVIENEIAPDPSDMVINKESFLHIKSKITDILSEFEQQVLEYHISGYSYTQIANVLTVDSKAVDNAIQRIKKKMGKNMYSDKEQY